ncbi:hypothetical protein [Halalkalibacterium ligniniphilum]|uniref:hypothetical protein n=1 Tax=Halalkalibacterium ligniniphilum TaxID=1134413 RepID=UPI000346F68F|nr:hypothetical protein [Halalkalibacterium ligniniphilum]
MNTSIPIRSIIFFILAAVWAVAAIVFLGDMLFWLFILMIGVNLYSGLRLIKKQRESD